MKVIICYGDCSQPPHYACRIKPWHRRQQTTTTYADFEAAFRKIGYDIRQKDIKEKE